MDLLAQLSSMPVDPFDAATIRASRRPFTDEEKIEARKEFNRRLTNHFAYKRLEMDRMLARRARRIHIH